jgi:hypothetical protein
LNDKGIIEKYMIIKIFKLILILKISCVFLSLYYELRNSHNRKLRIPN